MLINPRTLITLGVLGIGEILGIGISQANAQVVVESWRRGGLLHPHRYYHSTYVAPAAFPPVVVAPAPVVVARPTVVVTRPTVIERQVIQPAPVVESRVVQPAPVVETRLVQPAPVVERRYVQPPPVVETRVIP